MPAKWVLISRINPSSSQASDDVHTFDRHPSLLITPDQINAVKSFIDMNEKPPQEKLPRRLNST
jgi:hypothetical protein